MGGNTHGRIRYATLMSRSSRIGHMLPANRIAGTCATRKTLIVEWDYRIPDDTIPPMHASQNGSQHLAYGGKQTMVGLSRSLACSCMCPADCDLDLPKSSNARRRISRNGKTGGVHPSAQSKTKGPRYSSRCIKVQIGSRLA
jgi:hypothetical protein